jgi:hypothetical protein
MRRLAALLFVCCLIGCGGAGRDAVPSGAGEAAETYYVTSASTAEVDAPSPSAAVVNQIYRGQAVQVLEVRDGWARTTAEGYTPRWVRTGDISTQEPAPLAQPGMPADLQDPRIAPSAIREVGEGGLTSQDVLILWRGAKHMLSTGRCQRVEYADKSVSRANTYFVNCGADNLFFTPSDLPPR